MATDLHPSVADHREGLLADRSNCPAPRDWQLVYTAAHHEKVVAVHFQSRGIEHLLPVHRAAHRWNKRVVTVDVPLFPGYVFLHCDEVNRHAVITTPGVVSLVTFQDKPAAVPHSEISAIVNALKYREAYPCAYLAIGQRVRVRSGPLAGVIGVIERIKGLRVIVSVDSIASSVAIEAEAEDLSSVA